jgi:polysaccharide chain length determinant protein (PEP-CTERM system associated)
MHDIAARIRTILSDMWRYRWQGLAVATLVALAGAAYVQQMRDRYQASARIFVDTDSVLKPLMIGLAVQPDIGQQVSMLGRTLISRPNVEKLLRMADLDLEVTTDAQRQAMTERLLRELRISSAGRDNLYNLSYADTDPKRAKRAVESLVSIFVETGTKANRKDNDSAKAFIDEQIKEYQGKLEAAETKLKTFRLKHIDMQFEAGRDMASRLAQLSSELEKAQLELREAEKSRDAAKAALAAETSQSASNASTQSILQESAISVSTPELDARIEAQRRSLDSLSQRFTDEHPDVVSTRRLLNELEGERKKQMAELRKQAMRTASAAPASAAPVIDSLAAQELRRMHATSEVQAAALRARVNEYASRIGQAKAALKTAPQLEAEAAQLNRDYAIHKKNYEDLVSRRETASISGKLEEVSGVADFRLIDPPYVSPRPVWPNRTALSAAALAAALASGLLVAFGLSALRPVFHNAAELRQRLELPVLGVVSTVTTAADRARQRMSSLRFSIAAVILVAGYLGAMYARQFLGR